MLDRKRVSTDTITGITSSPDFTDASGVSPAPTTKQLIDRIRKYLKDAEKSATGAVLDAPGVAAPKITLARAQEQIKELEIIINNVPRGFDLVPVLYDRIAQDENQKISDEYIYQVRSDFLTFLAENHAAELKDLGICEYGINRMKLGLDPSNKKGDFYDISIDHIVERSGCGLWADSKAVDPDQPDDAPRYRTNHFGNFILLPEKIHHFKNALNTIQRIGPMEEGDAQWMIMLIPKRDHDFSGFVCPKQDADYPLAGLAMRAPDIGRKISHIAFTASQALASIKTIMEHPVVAANDNAAAPDVLAKAFNDASLKDKALKKEIKILKPQLAETARLMGNLFNEVSAVRKHEKSDYDSFVKFFKGRKVKGLLDATVQLPFAEASLLHKTIEDVGREIDAIQHEYIRNMGRAKEPVKAAPPKPVNDDQPKKQPPPVTAPKIKAPQYGRKPRK